MKECRTLAAAGFETVLLAPVDEAFEAHGVTVRPVGVVEIRLGIPALARRLRRALRAALRERADLYHLHDPELVLVGYALKVRGRRVIYDAHEDTPREVVSLAPQSGLRVRLLGRAWAIVLAVAGRWFDGVVAATPAIAAHFPGKKTALVRNYALLSDAAVTGSPERPWPPEVVYVGGLSEPRGVRVLVEAIRLVPDVTLVLAGPPQPQSFLDELSATPGWQRVRYEGQVSRERVATLLAQARAGLVVFRPDVTHVDALPNKLFEYMAAGLPVVASGFPLWRKLAEGCAVFVDPTSPQAVADAIGWLLAHPEEAS